MDDIYIQAIVFYLTVGIVNEFAKYILIERQIIKQMGGVEVGFNLFNRIVYVLIWPYVLLIIINFLMGEKDVS